MPTDRHADHAVLDVFVGEWTVQAGLPDIPAGRVLFEWALDRTFLLQRSDIPRSPFPSSLAVIAPGATADSFTQHYFDSRGVVRVYRMILRERTWTLLRTEPDFTPLDFAQRFRGTVAADGNSIDGRWETSPDGESWELDFTLTYTRTG